ncbi:MAG: 4-hydroxy-tetrahydrodipicolinate reductase [Candidatus Omnitrophica bacterium]|nr:4-hydroxy-tetrahydrodipicolinate reductase [Candidatus Omnitrophota bacterium]
MIKLAVTGCQGRMGQRITHLALEDDAFTVQTLLEHKDHPKVNEKINDIIISTSVDALKGNDVIIDFTTPESTLANIEACVSHGVKMVIGTTGFTPEQIDTIHKAAETIPIVFASNMSIGVNILFKLAQTLAQVAPDMYKVTMTEAHHIHKKDAPSGTAKTLAEHVEQNSSHKVENIESIREGEIIGDHKVFFESPEDIITIDHHAKNRDIFAKGSLVAAKFLTNKEKGLFNMQDVLGLN